MAAGSTYPLLARLEKAGLVVTEQQPSPTGAPRRYYSLSDAGRAALEAGRADWLDVAGAVSGLLAWAALSRLGDPRAASTAAWVAGLLPLGGGVAAVAGVVTAATQQFGVRAQTFVAVGVVVLAVLAGTVVLARLLAVRLVRREDPTG